MNILKLLRKRKRQRTEERIGKKRFEVTLSGSGGQGIVLAGKILAEAASIFEGKEAVMTMSYGPEARGGASKAEVIVSDEQIDYPKTMNVDVLLVMTQEAMDKYENILGPEGLLIVNETFVKEVPDKFKNVFKASFSELAIKILDAQIVANIVALGALAALTGVITREALIKAVLARAPEKILVLDRIAVDIGYKVVKESGFKPKMRQ